MTESASPRSALTREELTGAFAVVALVPAARVGALLVSRRAERFCCAKMIAGSKKATVSKITVSKNLFLTQILLILSSQWVTIGLANQLPAVLDKRVA